MKYLTQAKRAALFAYRLLALPFIVIDWAFGLLLGPEA